MSDKPIALTGAAGGLGRVLRERGLQRGWKLRSSARRPIEPLQPGEDFCLADLRDPAAIDRLLAGVDVLIHMGGTSVERPLPEIIDNNLTGLVEVYEGARRQQVRRIVFASSNHTIGMYRSQEAQRLPLDCAPRPDSFYGLSKVWGETLGRMYWDKHGIETVSVRIGSCLPQPTEPRHLSTWLGHEDLLQLMECCFRPEVLGYLNVWGVSNNTRSWWDNAQAAALGYRPQQNAEDWAAEILSRPDPLDTRSRQFQGGNFVTPDMDRDEPLPPGF
jgi:uronate dehydrogenase